MGALGQLFGQLCRLLDDIVVVRHVAGDDQRHAGFVYENGVGLVDNAEVMPPLHHLRRRHGHVVAQVIKSELGVCTVSYVGIVGGYAFIGRHIRINHSGGKAKKIVDGGHPFGIAFCEIVIHCNEMDTFPAHGI